MVRPSRATRTKISCSICCIGMLVIFAGSIVIYSGEAATATYEDNDNVQMNLTHVTGTVVVWGTGQASITQRLYFELTAYSSYYSYTLNGLYWATNERVLPNSTTATIYVKSGGKTNDLSNGPTSFSSYAKDTAKSPSVAVVEGGKKLNINHLGFYGSSPVIWCLEVSYNTENMVCFYDDGRALPEGQTLPGTLVGDLKTQFVFFPPTFSQDSTSFANYSYQVILANCTVPKAYYNGTTGGINATFVDNVAQFKWVDKTQTYFPYQTFTVANFTDTAGTAYNERFSIHLSDPYMFHSHDETDDYISFDVDGPSTGIWGPMEHPNQSFNTAGQYLSPDAMFLLLLLVGGGLFILAAIIAPYLYVSVKASAASAREKARVNKERNGILQKLAQKGFTVPKKSQENIVYLRALEETIYSDHFQELFQRAEITREDLMTDQNKDGKIDEKDVAHVIEVQMRKIFEKDILDELQQGGLVD